jgi:hypothetical protein
MAGSLLAGNYAGIDVSRDDSARRVGQRMFGEMDKNAVFLGMWEHVPILAYLQLVEGQRPVIHIRNMVFVGPEKGKAIVKECLSNNIPVYTTVRSALDGRLFKFHRLRTCPGYDIHWQLPEKISVAIPELEADED